MSNNAAADDDTSLLQGLSSTITGLKFMQRSIDEAKKRAKEQADAEAGSPLHWVSKGASGKQSGPVIVFEASAGELAGVSSLGRQSFGSFNPAVERLQQVKKNDRRKAAPAIELQAGANADISDDAMAQRLGAFVKHSKASDSQQASRTTSSKGKRNKRAAATSDDTAPSAKKLKQSKDAAHMADGSRQKSPKKRKGSKKRSKQGGQSDSKGQ